MNLRGCKWDTQLGDVSTLAPFALVLPRSEWNRLETLAESLSSELAEIECQVQSRSDLWPQLGLPKTLLKILKHDEPWTPAAARVVRYDFHPTAEGWQISEVNSDVPGGFNEASTFTAMMAGEFADISPGGDPLRELARALTISTRHASMIALLTAPGYTEDLQIVTGLAAVLETLGIVPLLARPQQLTWERGHAFLIEGDRRHAVGSIYRFYQGEWLSRVPAEKWQLLLRGGNTPVCNPGASILTESKRLPLLWPELGLVTPTWRRLLAETQSSTQVLRKGLGDLVLKPAYCNTGDVVVSAGWQSQSRQFQSIARTLLEPRRWVVQRKFKTLPLVTPLGAMYPCLGVYTINGVAAGIYGRLSPQPVIDYSARDVAILSRE